VLVLLARVTGARPQLLVDVVSDDDDVLACVPDELDHGEEENILHQCFLAVGSNFNSMRNRINLRSEKWRKRDPILDDSEVWVGPIEDVPWGEVPRSSRRAPSRRRRSPRLDRRMASSPRRGSHQNDARTTSA